MSLWNGDWAAWSSAKIREFVLEITQVCEPTKIPNKLRSVRESDVCYLLLMK
jgi:hypothetical protein